MNDLHDKWQKKHEQYLREVRKVKAGREQIADLKAQVEALAKECSLDDNNQALVLDGEWTRATSYRDWIKWAEQQTARGE